MATGEEAAQAVVGNSDVYVDEDLYFRLLQERGQLMSDKKRDRFAWCCGSPLPSPLPYGTWTECLLDSDHNPARWESDSDIIWYKIFLNLFLCVHVRSTLTLHIVQEAPRPLFSVLSQGQFFGMIQAPTMKSYLKIVPACFSFWF